MRVCGLVSNHVLLLPSLSDGRDRKNLRAELLAKGQSEFGLAEGWYGEVL